MKLFIVNVLFFTVLASCASKKNPIQEQISSEQVRTLKEIQHHSEMIVEAHPELSIDAKDKVKKYMKKALDTHQVLKDEESKIIQLLLSKSLSPEQPKSELRDKKSLKKKLQSVYESKAENIFSLITQIAKMSEGNEINEGFEKDVELFIRDFR